MALIHTVKIPMDIYTPRSHDRDTKNLRGLVHVPVTRDFAGVGLDDSGLGRGRLLIPVVPGLCTGILFRY